MPNWCMNTVTITDATGKKVEEFKDWLKKVDQDFSRGHLPNKTQDESARFFFDVYYDEDNDYFTMTSKWVPPVAEMIQIGKDYEFSFELEYEESGMLMFGAIDFNHKDGTTNHRELTEDEWVDYEDEDGNEVEDQNEQLEALLQNKPWEPYAL